MTRFSSLLLMLLLFPFGMAAQTGINVGTRVMTESSLSDSKYYVIYQPRNATYVQEPQTGTYAGKYYCPEINSPTDETFVFQFLKQTDGTYKIKNVATGRYVPQPTAAGIFPSTDEASAGAWNLQFDNTNGAIFPLCNGFGWDRGSSQLWATVDANATYTSFTVGTKSTGISVKQYVLYEVALSSTPLSELNGGTLSVSSTAAASLETGRWYVMFDRGASEKPHGYLYEKTSSHTLYNTAAAPGTDAATNAQYLVRLSQASSGTYYVQNGLGNYFGKISKSTAIPTMPFAHEKITIGKIAGTDGHFYLQASDGTILDANDVSNGDATVVGWGTTVPTATGGNNDWAFYPAEVQSLISEGTALTAAPTAEGWYAIKIQSKTTDASVADHYVYTLADEFYYSGNSTNYPLSHKAGGSVSDATYLFRITPQTSTTSYWQMPNGKYLVSANSKFPVSSTSPTAVEMTWQSTYMRIKCGSNYADAYNGFMGETGTTDRTKFEVRPITLSGLTPWRVVIEGGNANKQLTCKRSDVSGLTSVYNGGWFFLPTSVTPTSSDFFMAQMESCTIDATNKTITASLPAGLAITPDDVSIEQGFQTAGRGSETMLLRITASPSDDVTNARIGVTFKDGAEKLVSGLTLYEASSSSPEILGTGLGAPTRTSVASTTVDGTSASVTLTVGSLATGTHYYWLGATVKDDATLGSIVDAAVTGIEYACGGNENTADLSAVGDPADRGAMVFNTHSYAFLPWDNGSKVYRIPAMVIANDGSIIVAADKRYNSYTDIGGGHVIDIVLRRSTDGGRTWGSPVVVAKGDASNDATCGYGDPTLTKAADGTLVCTSCAGNLGFNYGLKRFMVSTSTDNGVTWSAPVDVTEVEGMLTNKPSITDFFITSGKGILTPEGILMYLVLANNNGLKNYVIYSTDKGAHWTIDDEVVYTGANEAKLLLTNDGKLIASVRQGGGRGFNTGTYEYKDGKVTFSWDTQYQSPQLNAGGYANNQDILYYQRETKSGKHDVIFHSMTTGQHANLKLYYSQDSGQNWTEFLNVQTKGARYVTMEKSGTEANPGSLYLFFEDQSLNAAGGHTDYNHYPLNFIEITREQLLQYLPFLDDTETVSDGKYYRIRSKLYGKHIVEKVSTHQLGTEDIVDSDYTALWKISLSGMSMKLQNAVTDRYIQTKGYSLSTPYTTDTAESTFTLGSVEGEDLTYVIYDYMNSSYPSYNTGLHSAASQNYDVVGWYASEDASKWIFEEVTPDELVLNVNRTEYQKMQDIINNTAAYSTTLAKYFTDGTCTALRSTYANMSDDDLRAAMQADGLTADMRNMALKVKNNTWITYDGWDKTERTFRVADHKAYSDYDRWTSIFKYNYKLGRLTNPTGIRGTRNELVTLYVGAIPAGQTLALEAVPLAAAAGTQTALHEGFNAVVLDDDCTLFIYHSVDNTTDGKAPFTPISSYQPVTVHIEGGSVNGYFDLTRGDTDADWAQLKTHLLAGNITDLKTERLTFHVPTSELKSAVGSEMVGLLNIWDDMLAMERSMQGLEEYDGYWNNPLSVTSPTSDYMHATNFGTFYADYTLGSIMNYGNMSTNAGNIWGPAHEMGHIQQLPINMIGCTEISNNVYSNIAVYNQGRTTSRSASITKTFTDFQNGKSWLDRVCTVSGSDKAADLWQCTHLYWQLYQYFHLAGYKTDFYPALYKALRANPMTHATNTFVPATEDYLKFYKTCCEVSGYDLTEFFQAYGFFTLPTEESYTLSGTTRSAHLVSDYGNYYVYTTQEMFADVRSEVKAMKLKPCNIIFIEDRITAPDATYAGAPAGAKKTDFNASDSELGHIGSCGETGQYTDFRTPVNGQYVADVDASGNVSITGGTGAVGFKVYDTDGNLVMLSNTHEFQLPASLLPDGYTLKVAQGDGGSADITPLYQHVGVSYVAGGYYTTIYSPVPLVIPAAARAFGATLTDEVLTLHEYTDVIPAMQGAVIEFENHPEGKAESFTYDFAVSTSEGSPIAGNRLTGSLVDTDPRNYDGTVFTFSVKNDQVGFYKYKGATLKAGKAFLVLTDSEAQSVRGFALDIPTGIQSEMENGQWGMDNGQCSIIYDLQGRRVTGQPRRGIYVVNGRKIVNR